MALARLCRDFMGPLGPTLFESLPINVCGVRVFIAYERKLPGDDAGGGRLARGGGNNSMGRRCRSGLRLAGFKSKSRPLSLRREG